MTPAENFQGWCDLIVGMTAGASTSPRDWPKSLTVSWAREEQLLPLSYLSEDRLPPIYGKPAPAYGNCVFPKDFGNMLYEFGTAAVKIAAGHLNKRGGVLIGDVVASWRNF